MPVATHLNVLDFKGGPCISQKDLSTPLETYSPNLSMPMANRRTCTVPVALVVVGVTEEDASIIGDGDVGLSQRESKVAERPKTLPTGGSHLEVAALEELII